MKLQDKIVFITGSSSGIGKEMACAFAKEKATIIITYHKRKKKSEGKKVFDECTELNASNALLLQLEITNTLSINRTIEEVVKQYGKIDILINDAGVISWKSLKEQTNEEIESQVRINLEGTIKMTHAALPYVTSTIMNVASRVGERALPNVSVYSATKFGIRGFTQAIAQELPHLKIFSLCPGMTATEMTGYRGVDPSRVADLVVKAMKDEIHIPQGGDLDAWEILGQKPHDTPQRFVH